MRRGRIRSTSSGAPGDVTSNTQIQAHLFLGTKSVTISTGEPPLIETFNATLNGGQQITATATSSAGNTSTFAAPVSVPIAFLVTNTAATGSGSLEHAILGVNADTSNPNLDTINFQIPASGPGYLNGIWTISLSGNALTTIAHPVVVNAESQPGFTVSPVIVLDGTGASGSGLVLGTNSDGSTIEGFDIINFTSTGAAGIDVESGTNVVQSNDLGVETDGSTAASNAKAS